MKKSRFSEEQIIGILREAEGDVGEGGVRAAQYQCGDVLRLEESSVGWM